MRKAVVLLYNNKKKAALIMSAVMLFSSVSCSATVGSADTGEAKEAFNQVSEDSSPTQELTEAVTTTAEPTTTVTTTTTAPVMKGNIYDSNGSLLLYSTKDENGRLLRYAPDENAVSFANVVSEMSGGFDSAFSDILTDPDPTYSVGDDKVGKSIQVTLDSNVQNAIYSYMQAQNIVGSSVVLRTDGSLLAEVSSPSYDPEPYAADTSYDEELAWGQCGNKAFQNATPGSCFKIMSEVISDMHGVTSLYDDGTWTDDGATIVNWDHDVGYYPIAERTLYSAFINSSNIFFAKAFDQIGTDTVLSDLNNIFHFGLGNDIECDFGALSNNIEIYCKDDLRRSAFGQSYVTTSPIFLAALGREAVFGDMVKPFALKNIVDQNDPSIVTGAGTQSGEVIASIPVEYRQNLLDCMNGVASNLGVYAPGYIFYAKTGTAETWQGDILYITGIAYNPADDPDMTYADYSTYRDTGSYVIIMQIQNPEAHDFDFASESVSLYQGLVDIVINS